MRPSAVEISLLVAGCWAMPSGACAPQGEHAPTPGAAGNDGTQSAGAGTTQPVGGSGSGNGSGNENGGTPSNAAQSGAAGNASASPSAGMTALGGGASGGAGGGTSGSASGPVDNTERCAEIETEYAEALAVQVTCGPGGANQCRDSAVAAPGCDCLVFIQPKDPFAIENLLNLQFDWFDADCGGAVCPAVCSGADEGICTAAGRCAAP